MTVASFVDVEDFHAKKIVAAYEKYEVLMKAARSGHPHFDKLDIEKLITSQAECVLLLCRLERIRVQQKHGPRVLVASSFPNDNELLTKHTDEANELIELARDLYHSNEIKHPVISTQGKARCFIEQAECLTLLGQVVAAKSKFQEAIRLCYEANDEATEREVTKRIQELQAHMDAQDSFVQFVQEQHENSEQHILREAFEKRAENGRLQRVHLRDIAKDLGNHDGFSEDELSSLWQQIRDLGDSKASEEASISFDEFWRWWMADSHFEALSSKLARISHQ